MVANQSLASLKIQPNSDALGAYLTGTDLRQLRDVQFAQLRQTWLHQLVLVVRGQHFSDDELMRFSVLDEVLPISLGQRPRDNKQVSVISNVIEARVQIGWLGDEEVFWHADTSYRECPPSASVRYALEIPPSGGDVSFSNMFWP